MALEPEDWPLRVQLGHAYKETGDLSAAEQAYRTAVARAPDDADVQLQLGHLLKLTGRFEEARGAYQRSDDLAPGGAAAGELAALARVTPQDTGKADGHKSPPTREPDPAPAAITADDRLALWRALVDAQAARDMKDWDKAASLYTMYLARNADAWPIWCEMAFVLERSGRLPDADEALRKAQALNAGSATIRRQRADILRRLGRLMAATTLDRYAT
jgi:Flp pilus assembly protein TadD